MTPLRQRMIADMRLRNLAPRTIQCYVARVATFARHFGRSPELLGRDEVRSYLLHLVHDQHACWSTYNQTVAALRSLVSFRWACKNRLPSCWAGRRGQRQFESVPSVIACRTVICTGPCPLRPRNPADLDRVRSPSPFGPAVGSLNPHASWCASPSRDHVLSLGSLGENSNGPGVSMTPRAVGHQ
jgi:hypothetical protein